MGYTYLVGWTRLGTWYYGVRFAKGCSLDDLWTKYFTSSNRVKKFRELHGEPDVVEIRRVFSDKLAAQNWERRLLKRIGAVRSPYWLNANDTFRYDFEVTPELLAKRGAGIKAHWDAMDCDARAARVAKRRGAWQKSYDDMDAAKREAFKKMSREKLFKVNSRSAEERRENAIAGANALKSKIGAMTEEERRSYFSSQVATRKASVASMAPEKKKAWRAKTSSAWTDEAKAAAGERMRERAKARHANASPEEKQAWREKLKGPRGPSKMTPGQLAERGRKISEAAKARKAAKS